MNSTEYIRFVVDNSSGFSTTTLSIDSPHIHLDNANLLTDSSPYIVAQSTTHTALLWPGGAREVVPHKALRNWRIWSRLRRDVPLP